MENNKDEKFNFDSSIVSHYKKLERSSYRYGLDEDSRKDLVSDTILKAIENRDKFSLIENENQFGGWLFTIMNNIFINNYRKMIRDAVDSYDNNEFIIVTEHKKYVYETDSDVLYDELVRILNEASLSDLDKKVVFGWSNGYSYSQISDILEIPLGTVKSKIFFAREKFKNQLHNNYE